ncbi:MAG: arylsulfatase regulator [Cyanothece sp. SIO1E1]|nr:arylsulfatase regulator [Cyanothece sp. SIO1E1]
MTLTDKQIRMATAIDEHVKSTLAKGGGDEALLVSLYDHMDKFKYLLDTCKRGEMDLLCTRYEGFYRFAKLMERLAEGIASGNIPVPKDP